MGWMYTHRAKGTPHGQWFGERFNHDRGYVIDAAGNFNEVYLAFKTDRGVAAVVVLTRWVPKPADGCNFGYKDIDETWGPCETSCPERILKLLTPVDDLYEDDRSRQTAQEWRDACWQRIQDRKARPTVHRGDVIEFAPGTYTAYNTTPFVYEGRGGRFRAAYRRDDGSMYAGYTRYRISSWREQRFTKVGTIPSF